MVATAASATVSNLNVVGMISIQHWGWPERASCNKESAMVRLPDQRSADRPPTFSHHLKAYIYLPVVQYLVSLSDGLVGYAFPLYNTLVVHNHPRVQPNLCVHRAHSAPKLRRRPGTEPTRTGLRTDAERTVGLRFLRPCHSSLSRTSPTPFSVTSCRRLLAPQVASHYVTRSSLSSRKPHSHHASFPRSMNRNRLRLRCAHRGAHAQFGRRWRRWRHTTATGT
jgi:hypothetical protein